MLKDRFYYIDAYMQEFDAIVLNEGEDDRGRYVILDNTAFYPTGGGQPHDTGLLNEVPVIDVEEVDEEIRHYIADTLHKGDQVVGRVNWERRFDHMQQHAGQHILTAAFVELFDIQTVSFHLGKELVSIDLDVEEVSSEQLQEAERLANRIILENRPIETKFVSEADLDQYKLRKALAVTDEIRLVIIPEFDYNGCGGTHPSTTGQVSAIKVLSTERQKKKVRIHFVCGDRVLAQLHKKNEIVSEAMKSLSSPEEEVPEVIEKILATNRALEKSLEASKEELLVFEANGLMEKVQDGMVTSAFISRSIQELQKLARLVVGQHSEVIVLFASESDGKLQFVAAKGDFVKQSMKEISTNVLTAINGKGGGSDSFVQGGGERSMSAEELLVLMREALN
ncbi:alanine--tRNA ligase-related protein [Chungangia koreensis]|uniref:Alanine--tRNA ligase-related protein n=1 Tax=Chungangia koreensis TaxID=752657 RepID=A0ABV8X175_9LACT